MIDGATDHRGLGGDLEAPGSWDVLLHGVDLLQRIAQTPNGKMEAEKSGGADGVQQFIRDLDQVRAGERSEAVKGLVESPHSEETNASESLPKNPSPAP